MTNTMFIKQFVEFLVFVVNYSFYKVTEILEYYLAYIHICLPLTAEDSWTQAPKGLNNIFGVLIHFILPEVFMAGMLLFLLLYAVFRYPIKFTNKANCHPLFDLTFSVFWINLFTSIFFILMFTYDRFFLFDGIFLVEFYSITTILFVLIVSNLILVLAMLFWAASEETNSYAKYEYPVIFGFSTLVITFLLSSIDFFLLYFTLESLSFCLYVLILLKINNKLTIEAAIKYFCLNAVASSFILYGTITMYSVTATANFVQLKFFFELLLLGNFSDYALTQGYLFILAGFMAKVGLFPFHLGLIDTYEGSSIPLTLYLMTVIKFVLLLTLIRILIYVGYTLQFVWSPVLMGIGLFSMLSGSVGALYQYKIKRFFAYSSLHQAGYIVLSLASGDFAGLFGSILYLYVYTFVSVIFFSILLLVSLLAIRYESFIYLTDLALFYKEDTGLTLLFVIVLFSLANLPPFIGFYTKLYIFKAIIGCSYYYVYWSAFPAVFTSIISGFYYLRIIKIILWELPAQQLLLSTKFSVNCSCFTLLGGYPTSTVVFKLHIKHRYLITGCYFGLLLLGCMLILFPVYSNAFLQYLEILAISCVCPLSLYLYLFTNFLG